MGCVNSLCSKQSYSYVAEYKMLIRLLQQFSTLSSCYSNDFVTKCHKRLINSPEQFILKYQQSVQQKQQIPYGVIQKWKLILYGTNMNMSNYIQCLGFSPLFQQQRLIDKTYRLSHNPNQIHLSDLYFHQSYKQIQKDSIRTYQVPQLKQQLFEKILKKIANHFPETGYALGINYIVGYFLLIGYSEIDSFYMFVHLALNQKFMVIGLYDKGFPLAYVLDTIFKNVLKRINRPLYQQIFIEIKLIDEFWIIKWFLSFYLSIFPIQYVHYVLDYVLTFGILGLSTFAVAFVQYFEVQIYKCEDEGQLSFLFKQIQNFKKFQKIISIQKLMQSAYSINIEYDDFDNLNKLNDNLYSQYFQCYAQFYFKKDLGSKQKMKELLQNWYLSIIQKRENFYQFAKSTLTKFHQNKTIIESKQKQYIKQQNEYQINNIQKIGTLKSLISQKINNIWNQKVEEQRSEKNISLKLSSKCSKKQQTINAKQRQTQKQKKLSKQQHIRREQQLLRLNKSQSLKYLTKNNQYHSYQKSKSQTFFKIDINKAQVDRIILNKINSSQNSLQFTRIKQQFSIQPQQLLQKNIITNVVLKYKSTQLINIPIDAKDDFIIKTRTFIQNFNNKKTSNQTLKVIQQQKFHQMLKTDNKSSQNMDKSSYNINRISQNINIGSKCNSNLQLNKFFQQNYLEYQIANTIKSQIVNETKLQIVSTIKQQIADTIKQQIVDTIKQQIMNKKIETTQQANVLQ